MNLTLIPLILSFLQDITKFAQKLKELKFADFSSLKEKEIAELDDCLNVQIPKLMEVRFLVIFILSNFKSFSFV